ncbi:hypothetical protein H0G86_011524 [Trichoderma simmonsii]|uniref:Peptidase S8/S53 domain-containing protein n=1 Tax=Trichoderma simmonsii TaxID=1491479 RepID=A0A8G0LLR2_9HYPO|nr:hypothetical protein H0G86_011524 [Trichoderma simmonsii]
MKDSVFLALGKLLVEIELGMRITSTERNRNGQPSLWLTLDKILEEDRLPSVGDDYLNAIEACLDLHQSNSELMPEERTSELSRLIYDSIVVNLEKEFSRYRKSRKRKRRCDVSPSSMDLGLSPVSADTGSIQIFKSRNEETNIAGAADLWNASFRNSSPLNKSANNRQSSIQPEESGNAADQGAKESSKQPQITTEESVMTNRRVLDDLEPDVSATDSRALRASNEFFSKMEGFLESYLPRSYTEPSRRAKVCIIDTGIDLKHPSVQGAKKRLREMISFKGDSMEDETGHGTLVAELVLRLAPEATLCVAKVAVAKTMPEEDTQLITRAIYWAVLQDADIISLSLALDLLDPELDYAIKRATEHGKIIVAAAGNDGLNMLRAYPASNRNVLCIHASDGKGKEGGISPNAWDNDDNFMTLGVDISLNWRGKPIVKSGTSFATAVAAAIAADALAIISPEVSEDHRKRLHSSEGMRLIFALLSKPSGTGYKYVAPWNLWGEDRSDKLIRELILDTLKR